MSLVKRARLFSEVSDNTETNPQKSILFVPDENSNKLLSDDDEIRSSTIKRVCLTGTLIDCKSLNEKKTKYTSQKMIDDIVELSFSYRLDAVKTLLRKVTLTNDDVCTLAARNDLFINNVLIQQHPRLYLPMFSYADILSGLEPDDVLKNQTINQDKPPKGVLTEDEFCRLFNNSSTKIVRPQLGGCFSHFLFDHEDRKQKMLRLNAILNDAVQDGKDYLIQMITKANTRCLEQYLNTGLTVEPKY